MRHHSLSAAQPWHLLHTDPSLTPKTSCSPLALPPCPLPSPLPFLMGPSGPHHPHTCRCQVH
uniref:Uncharacterized protein n=1 Tax=Aotus nancymaae TaxID=37293 RepID=A0A2K5DLC2_AOTNA